MSKVQKPDVYAFINIKNTAQVHKRIAKSMVLWWWRWWRCYHTLRADTI